MKLHTIGVQNKRTHCYKIKHSVPVNIWLFIVNPVLWRTLKTVVVFLWV